jgi:hypothetical protein
MNDRASTTRPIVIVERHWPGVTLDALEASGLGAANRDLDVLGSIVVPADELVLSIHLGSSLSEVAATSRASGLPFTRVVPATSLHSTTLGWPGAPVERKDDCNAEARNRRQRLADRACRAGGDVGA